jgi:hypothetical protein
MDKCRMNCGKKSEHKLTIEFKDEHGKVINFMDLDLCDRHSKQFRRFIWEFADGTFRRDRRKTDNL